jgi:metallo-beta-lactamase family protein
VHRLDSRLRLTLHEAGHILGSASVDLETDDARVLCSGDLGRPNSPLLRDYEVRSASKRPPDLIVMESTYGDRDHSVAPEDTLENLERIINTALRDGGHILVPSFAIGRTQTLLYYLNALVESGRIDDVPVAVDSPMALRVTETYSKHRQLFDAETKTQMARGDEPLDFKGLYAVERRKDSERLRTVEQPMIIIAGSGMCTGGRIVGHLAELLPLPETCVLFVGYQARGTTGRKIQDAQGRFGTWVEGR